MLPKCVRADPWGLRDHIPVARVAIRPRERPFLRMRWPGAPEFRVWKSGYGPGLPTPESTSGDAFPVSVSMFNSVQKCSILVQNSALVKGKGVDKPKSMRIFVQLSLRVRT